MKSKFSSVIILATLFAFTSCVSNKKFKASQDQVQQLTTDLATAKSSLATATSNLNTANAKIADLNSQVSNLTAQNAALVPDAMAYKQIKGDAKAQKELMNALLAQQGTSLTDLRDKLIAGLSQLSDSGIQVTLINGLLYVNLPEKALFNEGSATLGKKYKATFSALTSVLNNYPNVLIYVIGNTDSLKIHNATFKDNWSLSTERANSIVRVFRDSYSVDPARLLSAGRSKYSPIADNGTKEGRAQNRRIQIILNPGLTGLWQLQQMTN
jgi:chemotaxis protein MotB